MYISVVSSADPSQLDPLKLRGASSAAAAGVAPASCGPSRPLRPGLDDPGCSLRVEPRGTICSLSLQPAHLPAGYNGKLSLNSSSKQARVGMRGEM